MARFIRQIQAFFRRPKIRFGSLLMCGFRGRKTPIRNAHFVGFLEGSGFRSFNPIRQERALNRRRFVVHVLVALLFLGFVWVMLESANALNLF